MHDHAACEQMMAAASRAGKTGRMEYLAIRCDMWHGDLATTQPTPTTHPADERPADE